MESEPVGAYRAAAEAAAGRGGHAASSHWSIQRMRGGYRMVVPATPAAAVASGSGAAARLSFDEATTAEAGDAPFVRRCVAV